MDPTRLTGPQAGVQKYDLLTALAIAGLRGTPGFRTSMLRLVALITARYNWKLDELTVGQREIARIWSVEERTVKREIKRLTQLCVLTQLRPGVRGRVAAYRLNQSEIIRLSAAHWSDVGPDFVARMDTRAPQDAVPAKKVVHVDFRRPPQADSDAAAWERVLYRLAEMDADQHRSWFAGLSYTGFAEGVLRLKAPSRFVAQYVLTHHLSLLQDVAGQEYPQLRRVLISG